MLHLFNRHIYYTKSELALLANSLDIRGESVHLSMNGYVCKFVAGTTPKYTYTHSFNINLLLGKIITGMYKVAHGIALVCMRICQFILVSQETR